jgi:hypothetical protein
LIVTVNDGQKGVLVLYDVDNRFYTSDPSSAWEPKKDFFGVDPKRLFIHWSKNIWQLIENEEIAVGMTEAMLDVACRYRINKGFIIQSDGTNGKLFECHTNKYTKRVVIQNGKVTKLMP